MSATTRAVIASRPGGPEVLQIVERLRPVPGEGEMLVRVSAAGINRPDVMQRQGNYPPPPGASDILGLELAGVVESLGSGVRRFKPGNRVMALVHSGAYAEWAVVQEASALPVPDGMSLVEAGAFPETYFTVWSNVFERAGLKPGETLLIHGGTSGIGTTALMLAKAIGAKVIVTAGSPEKCEACLKLGADGAIDYRRQDFVAVSKELTGGCGPDVILDMVGGDYIARNLEAVAVDGASPDRLPEGLEGGGRFPAAPDEADHTDRFDAARPSARHEGEAGCVARGARAAGSRARRGTAADRLHLSL